MKIYSTILLLAATAAFAGLTGCRAPDDQYHDDAEYSDMPWNTPQDWEGSKSMPGIGGGQGY